MRVPSADDRRRQHRRGVQRAILDATETLLLVEGVEGFSIRRLVERCGYTAPTIYHHFGDKHGLLEALLEERFQKLFRSLRRVPRRDDPAAYLREMARTFVRFGLRHPRHYQVLSLPQKADWTPPPSIEESREMLERPWVELWEAGRLRAGDVESAGQALWSLAHGLIVLISSRPDHPWSKTVIDDAIDALLRGLVAPPPAQRPERASRAEGST
jgi:AcrR family transcriptional regulator